jgi:hypothetical protein
MYAYNSQQIPTQNELLMENLKDFYKNQTHFHKMMKIINGESKISLRIVDWFVTNYAKMYYTVYDIESVSIYTKQTEMNRFKVYEEYKLKLKAYSKKRFDPFCRRTRTSIPYNDEKCMETTIGQLNFFKWAIENSIIDYIEMNYSDIEKDMNSRNSTSKRKNNSAKSTCSTESTSSAGTDYDNSNEFVDPSEIRDIILHSATTSSGMDVLNDLGLSSNSDNKLRKKREELSVSACKCIKKESVKVVMKFTA